MLGYLLLRYLIHKSISEEKRNVFFKNILSIMLLTVHRCQFLFIYVIWLKNKNCSSLKTSPLFNSRSLNWIGTNPNGNVQLSVAYLGPLIESKYACHVMLCCLILCAKSDAPNACVKSYALLCCVMICYADLFYVQNPMLSMSKILWSVMLCYDLLCWLNLWTKSYALKE